MERVLEGKVVGTGLSGDISITRAIYGDSYTPIRVITSQVGRINQGRACRVKFADKSVIKGLVGLIGSLGWKIRRIGTAGDVGVAAAIQGQVKSLVGSTAAQVGGIN